MWYCVMSEQCDTIPKTPRPTVVDERLIESIVRRILEQCAEGTALLTAATPSQTDTLDVDDVASTLGQDGLEAIFGVFDSLRQEE